MIEDTIHNDVNIAIMACGDKFLQPGNLFSRSIEIISIAVFDGKVLEGLVAPIELRFLPGCPGHEQDGIEAQVSQVIELISNCIKGSPHQAVFVSKIIKVHFIDNEILKRF